VKHRKFREDVRKKSLCNEDDQTLGQAAWRVCEVFIPGDSKRLTAPIPKQQHPDLKQALLLVEFVLMVSRAPFQLGLADDTVLL